MIRTTRIDSDIDEDNDFKWQEWVKLIMRHSALCIFPFDSMDEYMKYKTNILAKDLLVIYHD